MCWVPQKVTERVEMLKTEVRPLAKKAGAKFSFGTNNTGQPPKLVGYDVSNTVTVTVRKIAEQGRGRTAGRRRRRCRR